ncbi:MAG: ParB N-terminal domain-containing protein [Nanoarchaeales archaeon]
MNKINEIKELIRNELEKINDVEKKIEIINELKELLHELSPLKHNPVDYVKFIKYTKIFPNEYNPNFVPSKEIRVLYKSLKEDGFTMPVVVFEEIENEKYIIVDGEHRYKVFVNTDLKNINYGFIPCSVLNKKLADRIISTIRHNVARGVHQIEGTVKILKMFSEMNVQQKELEDRLGLTKEEINRYRMLSGLADLFKKHEYSKAFLTIQMLKKGKKIYNENE